MEKQKNNGRVHLRNDLILIVSVLLLSAIALIYLFAFRKNGNTVRVTVDGKEYGTYLLSENVTHEIVTGENKENFNTFVISDGKVYMKEASCPDGICVSHRPVFRNGQSIVCLPNRVVVTVIDKSDADSPDIVA